MCVHKLSKMVFKTSIKYSTCMTDTTNAYIHAVFFFIYVDIGWCREEFNYRVANLSRFRHHFGGNWSTLRIHSHCCLKIILHELQGC